MVPRSGTHPRGEQASLNAKVRLVARARLLTCSGAALLALTLAACQGGSYSTLPNHGSTVPLSSSRSETRSETLADGTTRTVTTSSDGTFSFSFGSAGAPSYSALAYAGRWEIRSNFGKSCTLELGTTAAGSNYQAQRSGFCTSGFDKVAQWSAVGGQLLLLDAQGLVRGRLTSDGAGGFSGAYDDGVFSPEAVTLRRA